MSGGRIGWNAAVLLAAEFVRRIMAFVVIFLVGRALSVEDFGIYRLSNAFMVIFLVVANFGLNPLLIKRIAANEADEGRLVGSVQSLKLALSLATMGLTIAVAWALGYTPGTFGAIAAMSLCIPAEALTQTHGSWYDGRQRMSLAGIVDVVRSLVLLVGTAVALSAGGGLAGVVAAYIAHYWIGLALAARLSRTRMGRSSFSWAPKDWAALLREASPFLLIGALWMVTFRVDMILLSKLADETAVGYYGAAYSLFEMLLVLPVLLSRALYPALARGSEAGTDAETMRKSVRVFFLVALPAGVGLAMTAAPFLRLVVGAKYEPAAPTLAVLSACLVLWFFTMGFSWSLTARGRLRVVVAANAVAFVVNVAANFALIPRLGYFGAGLATITSELAYFAVIAGPVHRELLRFDHRLVHPGVLVSTAALAAAVWATRGLGLAAMVPCGAAAYVLAAWVTGAAREPFLVAMVQGMMTRAKGA